MATMHTEIDECDRIWALEEARLDHDLSAIGLDLGPVFERVEAMLGAQTPARCVAGALLCGVALGARATREASAAEAAGDTDGVAAAAIEMAGVMRWFDVSRGFGFMLPDNGESDVLVHITCLRAAGRHTIYEGSRLHALVQRRPQGLVAVRILRIDDSRAIHPSQLPQRTHVVVQIESDWQPATVKWYNREKGFGFLSCGEGTEDIFLHAETLRRWGFAGLRPGQVLEVRWGRGRKGCMAAELRQPGGGGEPRTVH